VSGIASPAVTAFLAHRSAAMTRLMDQARRVAASDANVLLVGESGTGKGVLARWLHDASARHPGPFVTIACANLPAELLESDLFGHEKGAFTGATDRKIGRFEQADGGTILIDGVSELAPSVQGKLLRAVQERAFERLAGTRTITVDVRILSSTQADLDPLVAGGTFRKDLYYRLNVVRLVLPPLRERMEDLPVLAEQILDAIARRRGGAPRRLTGAALERLKGHDWPGNVRELENVLEGASIVAGDTPRIDAGLLPVGGARQAGLLAEAAAERCSLAQLEERYIRDILKLTGNNRTRAARILGINRKTLLEKRKRYRIT
jgi:two-component system response regulator HydG